jgi:hypothetical protein
MQALQLTREAKPKVQFQLESGEVFWKMIEWISMAYD